MDCLSIYKTEEVVLVKNKPSNFFFEAAYGVGEVLVHLWTKYLTCVGWPGKSSESFLFLFQRKHTHCS